MSPLRKALASCVHDSYVIRNERLHPLAPRSLQRTVTWSRLIQSMHSGENYLSSILPQRRVAVLYIFSTHRKQKSISCCILFLFCLSTNACCKYNSDRKIPFSSVWFLTLDITISVLSSNNSYTDIGDRKVI